MQDRKYCFANVAAVLLSVTQLLYKPYHYNHWVNVRSYQRRLPRNTQVYPVPVPCPLSPVPVHFRKFTTTYTYM